MVLPPLMHGAAQWACFMLMAQGATLVFPDDTHRVDPDDVWTVVEREKANTMTIVGDAMLRPLLLQLDKKSYDLSSFFAVGNGGAPLTPAVRAMAVERIPNLVISDSAGSSETGAQMHVTSVDDVEVGTFLPGPGTVVTDETFTRVLEPGHEGNGWLAQTGSVPLGYLGDEAKTARTFPVIDGVRYSIPGDRARHLANGEIQLLGRDSVTVNSGGEKIFVEEVERAIAGHPAVADVVVTGRPSERWGSEVVAVVQLAEGAVGRSTSRPPSSSRPRPTSPATSCPRTWCSSSGSSARPRARRTTAGPPRPPSRRRGRSDARCGRRRDGAAGAATVHRHGPGTLLRAEHASARGGVAGLVADEGRERRHDRALLRRDRPRGLGALGGRGGGRWWHGGAPAPFVGMVGLHRVRPELPCAPAVEVGWRLHPDHWGHGLRHRGGGGVAALRLRGRRARRDRRLHDDAATPARRR